MYYSGLSRELSEQFLKATLVCMKHHYPYLGSFARLLGLFDDALQSVDVGVYLPELLHVGHLLLLQQLQLPPVLGQALLLLLQLLHVAEERHPGLLQVDCFIADVLQSFQLCKCLSFIYSGHVELLSICSSSFIIAMSSFVAHQIVSLFSCNLLFKAEHCSFVSRSQYNLGTLPTRQPTVFLPSLTIQLL